MVDNIHTSENSNLNDIFQCVNLISFKSRLYMLAEIKKAYTKTQDPQKIHVTVANVMY